MERTLSIVKPDAVRAGKLGGVLDMIEASGLRIVAMKMIQLDQARAEGFYAVHRERPFFKDLVKFMTSGPVVVSVLEGLRLAAKADPEREKPQYVLSTTTLLLLRDKALTLSVYAGYVGPADIDWIRAVTLRWVDELLRLNRSQWSPTAIAAPDIARRNALIQVLPQLKLLKT